MKASLQSMEELYRNITFGSKPALILVDFCHGCTDSEMRIGFDQDEAIANSGIVLEAARAK